MRQLALFDRESRLIDIRRKVLGTIGEKWAYNALERAGYEVALIGRGDGRGDLLAIKPDTGECWHVEVKTSRPTKYGWQFLLRKNDRHGRTDVSDSDVVILLAVLDSCRPVVFIIPTSALGNRKTIAFRKHPEHYAGQWAQYRQEVRGLTLEAVEHAYA